MSTRGWQDVTPSDIARMQRKEPQSAKPSKYRNVRVVVDGEKFDSKREAQYWAELKMREKAGDITQLRRQVPFSLSCRIAPEILLSPDAIVEVCRYIADFVYIDRDGQTHVVDAKGKRTAMYALKKKWLELQSGIVIEEV